MQDGRMERASGSGAAPHGAGELRWAGDGTPRIAATCPTCGTAGEKRVVLQARLPQGEGDLTSLLACGSCGCDFFDPLQPAEYEAEAPGGGAALAFYLQQGAGIGAITLNLATLDLPAGSSYLEIGCGFGFGLDFAARTLTWRTRGLDPYPFAAAGREQLGLPIESRYLLPGDSQAGTYDAVMASEVIEHVPDPVGFASTLRAALGPDGVLVLTTPAAEAVSRETPPGLLVPLLSLGFHLVLHSAASLETVLRRAGFAVVEVERRGASLFARAAVTRPRWHREPPGGRALYRQYLADAMAAVPPGSDLWLGFAARAYREAVGAQDKEVAEQVYGALARACTARYGRPPHEMLGAPATGAEASLEALVAAEPLCLGGVLLHRAWQRLQAGAPSAEAVRLLDAAAAATERLRAALRRIGSDDGDAEDVGWTARAEAAIAAAGAGSGDVGARLAALGPAPGEGGAERAAAIRRRCFVQLVNDARFEQALPLREVSEAPRAKAVAGKLLTDDELDALFCRGVLELQRRGGEARVAFEVLGAARTAAAAGLAAGRAGSARTLLWPILEAELLAMQVLGMLQEAAQARTSLLQELAALPGAPPPPPALRADVQPGSA